MFNGSKVKGFALVELVIVLLVSMLFISSAAKMYSVWIVSRDVRVTQQRIVDIKDALRTYVLQNRVLPCVASLTAPLGDANFGSETDCTAAPVAGTYSVAGRDGLDVRIGAVPIAALREVSGFNISSEHAFDAWGGRFTYAVTAVMTDDPALFTRNVGAISVVDPAGNTFLPDNPETAIYTIVSHGRDGAGSHGMTGALRVGCVDGRDDTGNCDYLDGATIDHEFVYSFIQAHTQGVNHYDDYVEYSIKDLLAAPTVSSFLVEVMECNDAVGYGSLAFGDKCATDVFERADAAVNYAAGETPETHGRLIHTSNFEGVTDGKAYIRATIPIRVFSNYRWIVPVQAAVYLNGELVHAGEVINPILGAGNSQGATGVVLAEADVQDGVDYTMELYVFHHCTSSCGPSNGKITIGTIHLDDHYVDGVVEIMQSGDL